MGRISKELKALGELKDKRASEYPAENKDYHFIRVKVGEVAMAGWLHKRRKKASFTKDAIQIILTSYPKREAERNPWYIHYYLYPGPPPDKKWGPVCP